MRLVIEIKTTTIRSIHKDEFLFLSLYLLLVSQYGTVSIVTIVTKPVFQYLTYRISNRDCVCTERKMNRVLGWLQWHKLFGRITPLEEVRLRRYERHKLNHVQKKHDILSVFIWKFNMGKWKKKDPWVGNGVYTVLDCHHPSITLIPLLESHLYCTAEMCISQNPLLTASLPVKRICTRLERTKAWCTLMKFQRSFLSSNWELPFCVADWATLLGLWRDS